MLSARPRPRPRPLRAADPFTTRARVAWIDRYRQRLMQALPGLAAIDAALLAVQACDCPQAPALCPDDSAARYAAARTALFG